MIKLYEYLQIVRWKIRTAKMIKKIIFLILGKNNWQLELAKNIKVIIIL